MSECKHESIDPYGCFCDGCGEYCDEIIRNQQAQLAALREALEYLRGECTNVDGDPEDYIEALKKADETLLEDKE